MGEAFLSFPSLQAQQLQGPKATATRTNGRRTFPAERPLPQPRAQARRITGHPAPRPGEVTSPTWAGTQTPFRRRQATDAARSGGRGAHRVRSQAPGARPASRRPSARGKLRLGLYKGPVRPSPRGEGRDGVELWFHPEKRGGDRDAGGARRESGRRKSSSRGLHLGASLRRGSWIREGKPKKELAPRRDL